MANGLSAGDRDSWGIQGILGDCGTDGVQNVKSTPTPQLDRKNSLPRIRQTILMPRRILLLTFKLTGSFEPQN
jgi:hypothetical protein